MDSILEVDSIQKSYGDRQLLTDIYLKCTTGDVIGLLGRNGSGKSTLLKIIFGTLETERKLIRINDRVYQRPYLSPGLLNYLPQHHFLLTNLTVKKATELYLDRKPIEFFQEDEIFSRLLNSKIHSLSGGELRYIEMKLLLLSPSKFVLLDEPFRGVSPVIIEKLKALIKTHSRDKGIIITDHDYRNVIDVSTILYLLYDGGLRKVSSDEDLIRLHYLPPGSDSSPHNLGLL